MEVAFNHPVKARSPDLSKEYTAGKVELVHGGGQYFKLMKKLIDQAADSIHLQTYIYDDDETGKLIGDALIKAAKRKVKIFLLADGYASQGISQVFINCLREGGVNFRFFEPIFKSKYF